MSCQIHVYDCLKIYMSIHHHNNNVEIPACVDAYAKGLCGSGVIESATASFAI